MLARWWVNGRPVIPERTDEMEAISIGRRVRYEKLVKVAFGLPYNVQSVKPGDVVGVQVLYSPSFLQTLPKSRGRDQLHDALWAGDPDVAAVPLLSNRIEFVVPASAGR
jgi:hypothetical protein